MSDTLHTSSGALDRAAAEPFEVGTVQWIRRPGDGDRAALSAGFWFITPEQTPGPMRIVSEADETIQIVEGHLSIEVEGGPVLDLRAGGAASLNKGVAAVWTVHEPTVEFFVYC